jgi:hypothetical protein
MGRTGPDREYRREKRVKEDDDDPLHFREMRTCYSEEAPNLPNETFPGQ